ERGYMDFSPAQVKPPAKHVSRERVLTESELIEVWNVSDALGYPMTPFLRCLIFLPQRRGEVARMRWRDIDLQQGLWTTVVKGGRQHLFLLAPPVIELLKTLPRFKKDDYVFTTQR